VHCPAQFLIGDVEVSLRRLQVCMTEEQLNRAQVETLGEPAASGLVAQVVPVQVDLGELLAVHAAVRARALVAEACAAATVRDADAPKRALTWHAGVRI